MIRALIKKQFLELFQGYIQNRKTGKARSKVGLIGYILLMVCIFLFLGAWMLWMADYWANAFLSGNHSWLYFAFMGLLSICIGVFGSVFNTYAALYLSKDNEMLLSMPIAPMKILGARMVGVVAMSFMYSAIAWIPGLIRYWVAMPLNAANVINPIIMTVVITVLVSALTCILGWCVAMTSKLSKGRTIISVAASLAFLGLYYVVYFKLVNMLNDLAAYVDSIESTFKGALYPFYVLGRAADGNVLSLIICVLVSVALFVLCCYVMSKNFIKIVTSTVTTAKKEYKDSEIQTNSSSKALFNRELKQFLSSATYILNCALGVAFMAFVAIAALLKADAIRGVLAEIEELSIFFPMAIVVVVCVMVSMNPIAFPSISLEGRKLWILQTMPIDNKEIISAKLKLHLAVNLAPAILTSVIMGWAFGLDLSLTLGATFVVVAYTLFMADFCMVLGILKANVTWTNEAVPIKQNFAILIAMFGGWGLAIVSIVLQFFLSDVMDALSYMMIWFFVYLFGHVLLKKWLLTRGAKRLKYL